MPVSEPSSVATGYHREVVARLTVERDEALAEAKRLRAVYDAACAWADAPRPVTGGAAGRLYRAVNRARHAR